ncbi:fatty acyl-AMP ligase [Amycolatopsis sp. BJA-103]|uniref:fatty acyl-AMP ligase n=1 Tax=Amycolatopsis sp. BJA-103 TaxID=1911175 RepID=UPI000C77960B|nr:fatty acyl-AMP ligase [Amycolatopsis sp. BJA-103]AUI64960.1 acyl-CoA synthetase [Amycolatopsis sp. BJA-103]PNE19713.1 acyl-CoA synthetase [Amycolatopsis sp. BJA-103]
MPRPEDVPVPEEVPEEVLRTPLVLRLLERADVERPAYTHLDCSNRHEPVEDTLTWADLLVHVRAVAAKLREVIQQGDRVAITARQDLSYVVAFFGALYAGAVAVPLSAPDVRAHRERLVGVLNDCDADIWLTSEALVERLTEFAEAEPVPSPREIIAVDTLPLDPADRSRPAPVSPEDPAYLQYTSGTTRSPAGVIITQRALSAACWQICDAYAVGEHTTCVGWIPFFHDMGLAQLLAGTMHSGGRTVFIAPLEFIRRPERWLLLMSAYPNTLTAAPNFAYDLVTEAVPEPKRAEYDLSTVSIALSGSEPVRAATVRGFLAAYEPHGFPRGAFRPSYGLAEATVYVASGDSGGPVVTEVDGREVVEIGWPRGQRVRVVAQADRDLPAKVDGPPDRDFPAKVDAGEIWVKGPNVAAGYWRRPELTAEVFGAELDGEGGWLRTGDLGSIRDGRLSVTGRLKDLIIIDGRNHSPHDIEETVADAHPLLGAERVAAFSVDGDEGEGVVVVAERARKAPDFDEPEIARAATRAVAERHDVRLRAFLLVKPGGLPRTSSGKVARSAARTRYWPADGTESPHGS